MKIIGMSARSAARRGCRPRPLKTGREKSSTRQLGTKARGRARNSLADEKVSGCQPSLRINNSRDSRTEMSSSTTKMMGLTSNLGVAPSSWRSACVRLILHSLDLPSAISPSEGLQCGANSLQQLLVAKRFAHESGSARLHRTPAGIIALVSGDEDDRNAATRSSKVALKLKPVHTGHLHVNDQAGRVVQIPGLKESLGRFKS